MVSDVLVWLLMSYGMTNIVVFSSIFEPMREWLKTKTNKILNFVSDLVGCPMCFGFWSGIFLSLTLISPSTWLFGVNDYSNLFFDGILSSGGIWLIHTVQEYFERSNPNV